MRRRIEDAAGRLMGPAGELLPEASWRPPASSPPDRPQPLVRASIHAGEVPPPGAMARAFAWRDVLRDPFPPHVEPEPARYVVPAPSTTAGADAIENALLLTVSPKGELLEVEDRIAVRERVLGSAIEAEREGVGAAVERTRERVEERAEGHRREATRARRQGGPRGALVAFLLMLSHSLHVAGAKLLAGVRATTRGVATMPDRLRVHGGRALRFLSTPEGRAKFRKGLLDPHTLHAEEKAVTLFTGTAGLLALLLVAHMVVTLSVPAFAGTWRTVFFLFLYAYVTSLGIPFPIEPVIFAAALAVGKPMALVVTVTAKVCAGWMVFFVGDAVHHRIREKAEGSERWARFIAWSERFAKRFGIFALALFIATPGLPDFVALYLFGALHMRMWQFLLGVAIGSTILNGIILYGLFALFGF